MKKDTLTLLLVLLIAGLIGYKAWWGTWTVAGRKANARVDAKIGLALQILSK